MSKQCVVCSRTVGGTFVEVDGYSIMRCRECATDFVVPTPTAGELKEYYDRAEWFEGGERGGYASYDVQTDQSPEWLVRLMDDIQAKVPNPYVLDIGCAYGTHLALAEQRGWSCFGVEPSDHARQIAQDRHKRIFITETIEEVPPRAFHLVLMLEVIEHLGDPYHLFYEMFAKGQITPDTVVAITTPNARSWDALADPVGWEFRHPPSHLTFYSGETFAALLKRLRFDNVSIEGQHLLKREAVPFFNDEILGVNADLAPYAGLKVVAKGSDFSNFMQERFVPGTWSELTAYEHLPRYLFACQHAADRVVLDFGCGSGYGAKALSDVAQRVLAVDIDEGALEFARLQHSCEALMFRKIDDLAATLDEASFDLVTCFEVIEHLKEVDQKQLLKNFRRVLKPDGLLMISTPNPEITSLYGVNPYHLKEMTLEEFRRELSDNFSQITIFNQKLVSGSTLTLPDSRDSLRVTVKPMYPLSSSENTAEAAWVACCANSESGSLEQSFYLDNQRDFVRHRVNEISSKNRYEIRLFEQQKRAGEFEAALRDALAKLGDAATVDAELSVLREAHGELEGAYSRLTLEHGRVLDDIIRVGDHAAALERELSTANEKYETLSLLHTRLEMEYGRASLELTSLQQNLSAVQAHHRMIETSLRWRIINKIARYAPSFRPFLQRAKAFTRPAVTPPTAGVADVPVNPVQEVMAPIDLIYETAREPKWNSRAEQYDLWIDEEYRTQQAAKIGTLKNSIAPYTLKPRQAVSKQLSRAKILHVIPNVYIGGSTQLIIDIVEYLSTDFEHQVVTSALWPAGSHDGLTVHKVSLDAIDMIQPILSQFEPDLVHVHYWGLSDDPWYWAALEQIKQYRKVPVVENVNTPIKPLISANISQYVFVSGYVRQEFGGELSDDLASVIYPGIDIGKFSKPFDGEDALNAVGMVYRLEDDKLKIDAIDLFIEVIKRRPRTRVYIIGGGRFLEPWIRKTEQEGVRSNFRFTGYVPYEQLPSWYDRFSIFIAPVWKESFGQVAPFAMSKRQVIAGYKIGALPEIAGSDEFFGNDVSDTAEIITRLLDDKPRREAIGLINQKRVAEMFSVEAMTSSYRKLYDRLLNLT